MRIMSGVPLMNQADIHVRNRKTIHNLVFPGMYMSHGGISSCDALAWIWVLAVFIIMARPIITNYGGGRPFLSCL